MADSFSNSEQEYMYLYMFLFFISKEITARNGAVSNTLWYNITLPSNELYNEMLLTTSQKNNLKLYL